MRRWMLEVGLGCWPLAACALAATWAAAARGDDWPGWRGPLRNGHTGETSGWKEGGWPLGEPAWRAEVGEGGSSPVVVAGRVYAIGWRDGRDTVRCLHAATGAEVWMQSYPAPRFGRQALGDQGLYSGVSSTPEFDAATGYLYTLGCDGELRCWNTRADGTLVWRLNAHERYDVRQRPKVGRSGHRDYGFTASPLVHGDSLIVSIGAKQGALAGLDKRTGEQLWLSEDNGPAGHNGGPVPLRVEGVPCVAALQHFGVVVARLDAGREGETVGTFPWLTEFSNNVPTPVALDNHLVLTTDYNMHKTCKLKVSLGGLEKVWETPVASRVCSPVIHQNRVYFACHDLVCLDYDTGHLLWRQRGFGEAGSLIAAGDGRLILFSGNGLVTLLEGADATAKEPRMLSQTKPLFATDVWPHAALAEGRLLLRDREGNLRCHVVAK